MLLGAEPVVHFAVVLCVTACLIIAVLAICCYKGLGAASSAKTRANVKLKRKVRMLSVPRSECSTRMDERARRNELSTIFEPRELSRSSVCSGSPRCLESTESRPPSRLKITDSRIAIFDDKPFYPKDLNSGRSIRTAEEGDCLRY